MASRTPRATRSTRVTVVAVLAVLVLAGLGRCTDVEHDDGSAVGMPVSSSSIAPAPAPPEPDPAAPPAPETAPPSPETASPDQELVIEARALLPELDVKGRAPKTGYDRDLFGQAWSDDVSVEFGRNGCDTRNDILQRDLDDISFRPNTRDCVVESGVLYGPYTGERIEFTRGRDTSTEVQIDHVVALSDAWQKGAQQLTEQQRREFANDPLNLLAVAGWANQQKSDGDAATWLPPRREFRCPMVARQVLVKERYGLWVTAAERDAMERVLSSC